MLTSIILRAALTLTAAGMAVAQTIAGGPMAVNVTGRDATVVWLVEDRTVTLASAKERRTSPAYRVEKTTFTGLQPGTRYEYNVNGLDSGKGSFQTALQGDGAFDFVVYGDTRTRHDVHARLIRQLLASGKADFVVNTGDQTENANDASLWPHFFESERELLRQSAFYPSLGNHERNSRNYYEFFQQAKPYYSFDWGSAHFSVIDSDLNNIGSNQVERRAFWDDQSRWLEEDLRIHQDSTFRFVVAHHPPMTAVARRQGDNPHMSALMPMFEKFKVSAALFGHDHNYQHYLTNGIHYLVSGGGGAPLYDVDKPAAGVQRVVSVENFIRVHIESKIATVTAISIDGKSIDTFQIQGGQVQGK